MKYFPKFYEIVIKFYRAIVILSDKFVSRPYFGDAETEITVQQGEAAFFNCHVFNLANQTVSELTLIKKRKLLFFMHSLIWSGQFENFERVA